jgi:hypothetical protein
MNPEPFETGRAAASEWQPMNAKTMLPMRYHLHKRQEIAVLLCQARDVCFGKAQVPSEMISAIEAESRKP